ncbi:protein ATP6V1FNB-like [Hydractinia symbiolongicarpus]|uniref:protein ATP6V1FNB-like n=1 Tax=Hydractinia symbiolongicarpus TaxID=13093 RepID=UPI00255084F5|nr:protein ATP6V1FNB-like [Hydractinia symbiolongicarpus]
MVRELNMDTQRQNFWKESIHKEATVRLAWHMRFSKEFANKTFQPLRKKEKSLVPKATRVNIETARKIKSKPHNSSLTDEDKSSALLVEMRPVSSQTRKLLYKGFSALGEGRYAYLQERKQKKPEQKYEFPVTSGWEYGWKITEAMKTSATKPAEFGRTRIVRDSFYRSNGVVPHDGIISSFQ